MVVDLDHFKELIDDRYNKQVAQAAASRDELLLELDAAKNHAIMDAFKELHKRLDEISARLPPVEEE